MCDVRPSCRGALQSFREDIRPRHIFTYVLDRLQPGTRVEFQSALQAGLQEYTMREFNGESRSDIVVELGRDLAKKLYTIVSWDGLARAVACYGHLDS